MEEEVDGGNELPVPNKETVRWYRRAVEIPLVVSFIAFSIAESVYSNLILYRTCTVTFGYNESICTLVVSSNNENETKELEEILQPQATKIIMAKYLIEGIFPAIISLFLGSWSDINGRKPLMISSLIGYFIFFCLNTGFSLWNDLDPWYIIISSIPFSFLGALTSLITGSFCYISDITDISTRSFRMAILEGGLLIGIFIGSIASPYAFAAIGYIGIFVLCAVLNLIGILYCIFVIKESIDIPENTRYSKFIDLKLITDMFKTCFKARPNYDRTIIWLVIMACSFGILVLQGDITVSYFFTREKLGWRLEDYSIFSAYSILATVFGIGIIAILFQKLLKLSDGIISMIAYLSSITRSVIIIFVTKSWHMYLGASVSCLRAVSGPINRSILTKVVPPEEAGKVLSLTTSFETIIPLVAAPLYTLIYQKTLTVMPEAYNIVSASIFFVCFVLIGIVEILQRRSNTARYATLQNEVSN